MPVIEKFRIIEKLRYIGIIFDKMGTVPAIEKRPSFARITECTMGVLFVYGWGDITFWHKQSRFCLNRLGFI